MLKITANDIKKRGGLLGAISYASTSAVRELLGNCTPTIPKNLKYVQQILTHKNPHLDEYMAMLLFKAALPESYWMMPLDEVVLQSASHDQKAMNEWPQSAVFGMGAVHSGGARAALYYDEHPKPGQKKKENSATNLTWWLLFGRQQKPIEFVKVLGEVDHIDCNANAHSKHLANYIKQMHDNSFALGRHEYHIIADMLTPRWKQTVIEACLAALLVALKENRGFTSFDYWGKPAEDSLEHYRRHTLLKDNPDFLACWEQLKKHVLGYKMHFLEITKEDGTKEKKVNKNNKPIPQLITVPYLAGICQDVWGPEIGQLLMVHLWETRILTNMDYVKALKEISNTIGSGDSEKDCQTSIGRITFRKGKKMIVDAHGQKRSPWVIEVKLNPDINNAKAIGSFIENNNAGVGYCFLKYARTGTAALYKCNGIQREKWGTLIKLLVGREGNSDETPPGCWHVTTNERGNAAPFLLNGNPAHRYTPRTDLTADLLAEFIDSI